MSEDNYANKANEIRNLAAMPADQLSDHLAETHKGLDEIAPNLAPHVHATGVRAIQFLNSKLPHAGNELIQDQHLPPSPAEKHAWLQLHQAVDDPVSVLDHVEKGTLTRHHVEALQSVYPELHQEMIGKMQEHLGTLKSKGQTLPSAKRNAISKFIGQPLDSTQTWQNMQAIIQSAGANTGPAAQASGKGPNKASGPELTQINKVNSLDQTASQARQASNQKS